jgi:hypothetical protein
MAVAREVFSMTMTKTLEVLGRDVSRGAGEADAVSDSVADGSGDAVTIAGGAPAHDTARAATIGRTRKRTLDMVAPLTAAATNTKPNVCAHTVCEITRGR